MTSTDEQQAPLILIIDDDKFMRIQLRHAMQQEGYQVAEANNGEEGLAVYNHLHPDVVLLDAIMPIRDGFSCCRDICSLPEAAATPVLMITVLEDPDSVTQAFEAGATDYITKPIHFGVLRQRVRRLLESRRASEDLLQQTELTQKSEEHLRLALEASHMGTWDWDIRSGKVVLSRTTEENLGIAPGTFDGTYKSFLARINAEDREFVAEALRRAIEERTDYDVEYRLAGEDNSDRWVASKGQVYYDGTGKAIRMTGINMDISEKQAARRERQLAEQKIREQAALLDITTDAILVITLEGKIVFWNQGAERLYRWKKEEAIGSDTESLFSQNVSEVLAAQKTLYEVGEWYGQLQQKTKTGQEIVVESRWTLVRNQDQPKSVLIVNTDVTEKKTLELQFLRMQRLESLGTLAGGIAHDLNNVLAPIMMSVQLLKVELKSDRSYQLLTLLETNVKRGADLVKQVLAFARGMDGDRTTLQVGHLIAEIRKIAQQTFPKSINIYSNFKTMELWMVSGNATQLHQVLMNLCVNARDAMPNGGTLTLAAENTLIDENYARMHPDAKAGAYIKIAVSDTGMGISPEVLDRIFEPFFTTKDLGSGTGLGLSTVLGIVKGHGGFIHVYSEVGRGSQFKVYLPANQTRESKSLKEDRSQILWGNGELILVVDDEAPICEVTKTSLEAYNYRVITASDGVDAVVKYAQHKEETSVVLLDMMMPAMDGFTTIQTLQKINSSVKIIAVSGLASQERVNEVMRLGAKAFLSKPYTTEQLLEALHKVKGSILQ